MPSSGRGRVYSFTVIHRPPVAGFDPPYTLAIVDLEEGWTMLSNVVNCDPTALQIGLPVLVTWLEADSFSLPVFEPEAA